VIENEDVALSNAEHSTAVHQLLLSDPTLLAVVACREESSQTQHQQSTQPPHNTAIMVSSSYMIKP